jgi:hypothetical protein
MDSISQGLSVVKAKATNQDSIITSLQNQINQLLAIVNNCCTNNQSRSMLSGTTNNKEKPAAMASELSLTKQTDVELSNKHIIVLDQNVPNPFAEQTAINYYLPNDFTRAQIIFLELSGKVIKSVDLTEKGKGTLNVFANDLTNGIYTYSLIIDGQTVETKKMVKQ